MRRTSATFVGLRARVARLGAAAAASSCLCVAARPGHGQEHDPPAVADLSFEALGQVPIAAVSRTVEEVGKTAASVHVLTAEDLRRSGARTIPDALRLVPGLHVARINANTWAISARGFNNQFADKMLVLLDGRSVYTPFFSGVYWNALAVPLEDIERIEVVRGPGGTLWGANAVNGIISIVTKAAALSNGATLRAAAGLDPYVDLLAQVGGSAGSVAVYRFGITHNEFAPARLADGSGADDNWRQTAASARVDLTLGERVAVSLSANGHRGHRNQRIAVSTPQPPYTAEDTEEGRSDGGYVLARVDAQLGRAGTLVGRASLERFVQSVVVVEERRTTFDSDLEYQLPIGDAYTLIGGAGYRRSKDRFVPAFVTSVIPLRQTLDLWSVFLQGQGRYFDDAVRLSLGAKAERNDYTGWEIQPSVRGWWQPDAALSVWAAATRAVRIPSRIDRGVLNNSAVLPPMQPGGPATIIQTRGNPNFASERLLALEAGLRAQLHSRLALDVAGFWNTYDGVRIARPLPPDMTLAPDFIGIPRGFVNGLGGHSWGGEATALYAVAEAVRLKASYSLLLLDLTSPEPDQTRLAERRDPRNQALLSLSVDLPHRLELDTHLRFVDELASLDVRRYAAADVRLGWRPTRDIELQIVARDLLSTRHMEYRAPAQTPVTEVGRTAWIGLFVRR